ncbi:MAG: hypothetical protein IPK79_10895 [Vampirovibrionales bacterium]|nr:hypothetical protein [Vampirovibrionales bacterium]
MFSSRFRSSRVVRPSRRGVGWVEVGVALLIGVALAALSLALLGRRPHQTWAALVRDFRQELSAAYESVYYAYGRGPLDAVETCGRLACGDRLLYPNGMADVLARYETRARYIPGPPALLQYPSGMTAYLFPERGDIPDPQRQLPQATQPDGNVMPQTHDREWILLDVNGAEAPNGLGEEGDRVLLRVDNQTGRVETAYQTCRTLSDACSRPALRSFYDVEAGDER